MESLTFSLSSPLFDAKDSSRDDWRIFVIVPRAHAYLADLLTKVFEGRGAVVTIVDRRQRERRSAQQAFAVERRQRDRRRPRRESVQVVIRTATESEPTSANPSLAPSVDRNSAVGAG